MTIPIYIQGADIPDLALAWLDEDGDLVDFSSGYTFALKVGTPGSAAVFTKSTGITGAATDPNVTVQWATSGELNTLAVGVHTCDLIATRTADSRERKLRFKIRVVAAIT